MRLVLEQTFPLGRFHATPWKVFPYDDPHGEWPPSPWRLVRAVLARSFQLDREIADSQTKHNQLRDALVRAFAASEVAWHLPPATWRGPGLRHYQPAEFDWGYGQPVKKKLITLSPDLAEHFGAVYALQEKGQPDLIEVFDSSFRSRGARAVSSPEQAARLKELAKAPKSKRLKRYPPDSRSYNTTKVLDNFWVTAGEPTEPVIWVFDGGEWTDESLAHLDSCLARLIYFGRAESITTIRRIPATELDEATLRRALPRRTGNAVPVLGLKRDATLSELGATTDAAEVANTNTPPGARWLYFERPPRPRIGTRPKQKPDLPPVSLIQFAIGCNVAPRYRDTVRITERFRARVLSNFTRLLTCDPKARWDDAPEEVRERACALAGRDLDGQRATGHRHASFLLCGESDAPSRLCVWRAEPFDTLEQRAILDAANRPLPLSYKNDPWTITLVPLDRLVSPPPGLDRAASLTWQTLTPYVPPRHVFDRKGKTKADCSVEAQLTAELATRGYDVGGVTIRIEEAGWVKVHRRECRGGSATNGDKRGYHVELTFTTPQHGPIALGNSCHFGLGLFVQRVL